MIIELNKPIWVSYSCISMYAHVLCSIKIFWIWIWIWVVWDISLAFTCYTSRHISRHQYEMLWYLNWTLSWLGPNCRSLGYLESNLPMYYILLADTVYFIACGLTGHIWHVGCHEKCNAIIPVVIRPMNQIETLLCKYSNERTQNADHIYHDKKR